MQHVEQWDDEGPNYAFIVIVALLIVSAIAIVTAVIMRREPDYALVLATPQDCLRAFDDTKCRAIVAKAMEVHASTAPRFADQRVCEMQFGAGNCTPAAGFGTTFYLPSIAAIVLVRGNTDDPRGMLPLYFDANDDGKADGRRVVFHGHTVGILHDKRFGGAPISVLTDLTGKPVTSAMVKRLRG